MNSKINRVILVIKEALVDLVFLVYLVAWDLKVTKVIQLFQQ